MANGLHRISGPRRAGCVVTVEDVEGTRMEAGTTALRF